MQAIILAGGLGTRLHPFTQVIPKPLLPVGDRSVLEIQIEHLKKYGINEIYFAANYKADLLKTYFGHGKKYGVKINYSIEQKRLGTCGPISLLKDKLHDSFLVLNGDVLTNIDLSKAYNYHIEKGGMITVVSKDVTFPLSYGNLKTKNDRVIKIVEKPDIKVEITVGIYFMSTKIFEYIPYNKQFGMDDLIKKLIKEKEEIFRYKMDEYWIDIGKMEDYNKAQEDYERHLK